MKDKNSKREKYIRVAFAAFGIILILMGFMGLDKYPEKSGSSAIAGAIILIGGVYITYRAIFEGEFWHKKDNDSEKEE